MTDLQDLHALLKETEDLVRQEVQRLETSRGYLISVLVKLSDMSVSLMKTSATQTVELKGLIHGYRDELSRCYSRIADITIDNQEAKTALDRAEALEFMRDNPPEDFEIIHGRADPCLDSYPSHMHWDGTIVKR